MARFLTLKLPRFPKPTHTPTPPALRLGDHTLTHAQLRQGLVLLGPEARTTHAAQTLAEQHAPVIVLGDPHAPLLTCRATTHAEFRLPVQAHDLPTTFTRLSRWSHVRSPIFNPQLPPTLLLIHLTALPVATLDHWLPILQGHNFAPVLLLPCEAPELLPLSRRVRHVVAFPDTHPHVRRTLAFDLTDPERLWLLHLTGGMMP